MPALKPLTARAANKISFFNAGLATAPWAAVMPYVKTRLMLDDLSYAMVLLSFGVGAVIGMPLTGRLAARFGVRRILVIATFALFLFMCAAAHAALPYWAEFWAVIGWGFSLGITEVGNNLHGTVLEERDKTRLLSGLQAYYTIGCIFGATLFPLLLMHGADCFLIAAGAGIGGCLLQSLAGPALLNTKGSARSGNETGAVTEASGYPRGVLRFVIIAGVVCMLMYLSEGMIYDWGAVYLIDECGFAIEIASVGYLLFQICTALLRLTGDRLVNRVGPRRIIAGGAALAFFCLLVCSLYHQSFAVLLCYALLGAATANIVPVAMSDTGRRCPLNKARAIALVGTMGYSGVLLGPALLGLCALHFGLPFIMIFTACCMVLMGILGVILTSKGPKVL